MYVVVLARKPLSEGTVAANVIEHGTAALHIDASRSGHETGDRRGLMRTQSPQVKGPSMGGGPWRGAVTGSTGGRWPTNLLLEHLAGCETVCAPGCSVANLDGQSQTPAGWRGSQTQSKDSGRVAYGAFEDGYGWGPRGYKDSGGVARYFKQIKPGSDGSL